MRRACWPLLRWQLQHSSAPVLVGPFRGEVGFEALYWVPFVRALGIPPERLIPVTRGGAHVWYPPHTRHLDLFTLRNPKDVRVANRLNQQDFGVLKQVEWSEFDRAVTREAIERLDLPRVHVLHPSWMYACLGGFWEQSEGVQHLLRQVDIQPQPLPLIEGLTLPEPYVAVRFYARSTFPYSDTTATVARETVARLARESAVIVLNSGIDADEHIDFDIPKGPNVYHLTDLVEVTPENNLLVQSAILAKAQGFVGTYGGLAQLALMFKKPTISLYQHWQGTMLAHKHYADLIATAWGVPSLVLRLTEIPLLFSALPNLVFQPASEAQESRKTA